MRRPRLRAVGAPSPPTRVVRVQHALRIVLTGLVVAGMWLTDADPRWRVPVTLGVLLVYQPVSAWLGWIRVTRPHATAQWALVALDLAAGLAGGLVVPDLRFALLVLYLVLVLDVTITAGPGAGLVVGALAVAVAAVTEVAAPTDAPSVMALVLFVGAAAAVPLLVGHLSRARLEAAERLERLHDALSHIDPTPILTSTLDSVAEAARGALDAPVATIVAFRSGGAPIVRDAVLAGASGLRDRCGPVVDEVSATAAPVVVEDPADTGFAHGLTGAVLAVPMLAGDEVVGALVVCWDAPGPISPADVDLLRSFADGVALLVWRAVALEAQRGIAGDLARRDRDRSEFLAGVAHELRTPLATITGFIETVLLHDQRLGPAERRRMLEAARRNADDLNRRVSTLLDFSRLEAERMVLQPSAQPLRPLVERIAEDTAGRFPAHELRVDLDPLLTVSVDEVALTHILGNLLENAAKYAPAGTTITVSGRAQGDHVQVAVVDHGPGVLPHERERIFERFVRGANQPDGIRGSGIGLSIVERYVTLSGGRVWVEDTPGGGATFRFTLPRAARSL